ncbi:MAG: PQQ-binding-like beta-propeller repeat protein [Planctomycetota bacterium]
MPRNSHIACLGREVGLTWGLAFVLAGWCSVAGAAEGSLPALRPADGVPASWREVKIEWKGSWDETLAANLDTGKWKNAAGGDESLRQAADLIVRLREIELLESMIAHFAKDQGQPKRQQAYVTIAQSYAAMGDRTRAAQWMQRLIADYPDQKPLAAEALANILNYSNPSGALPNGRAWAEFASGGLESLVKAGALPPTQPSVVQARQQMVAALRAEQRPQAARRYLDSLQAAEGTKKWWLEARASLVLAAGHLSQAAALYAQMGNDAQAKALRESIRTSKPDVDVAPPPAGLEERLERLDGAIRLTGKKALENAESVQDVVARAAESGAIQVVDEYLQASSAALLDRSLSGMRGDLGPLRQLEQQHAKRLVDALPEQGGESELAKFSLRYPWSQRVQEALVERGEQALRDGRHEWAARAFETAAVHADDPALLAQARLGLWLALGQGIGGPEPMEQAMAEVPDAAPMPRLGQAGAAADVKAYVRRMVSANDSATLQLPRSPSGRVQLPAAMVAQPPASRNRWESWCLGPWAIRRVEWLGKQLMMFGPRYVACYDGTTMALRWHQAAPGTPADRTAEETPSEGDAARIRGLWRPAAMGTTRSSSAGGRVVYALFGRGEGGSDLSAFDAASGRVIWTTQGRNEWEATRILSEPTAGQDCVYVLAMEQSLQGACNIYLVCLAADDAKIVWKRRLAAMGYQGTRMEQARYACGLAIHQGSLYISTNMGVLAKCEARDGGLEWLRTYATTDPGEAGLARTRREGSVPLVMGPRVYFAPRDHSGVIALDRQTGQLVWESVLVPSDQIVGLSGRALVVRDAGEMSALDSATGEELWSRPVDSSSAAPAVMAGQNILVTAGDKILRLVAQTGQIVEDVAAPRAIGTEQVLLPGGSLLEVSEEARPGLMAAEPGPAAGPLAPPFAKRWTLACQDPLLVTPSSASQPPSDLAGVLSGARFYCLKLRPACQVIWQLPLRESPDSTGFHGRLVVFATGPELVGVDKETGAVRWRRTLPFPIDFVAGDDRVIVAGRSSPEAPVMALAPETGAVLWYRWFGQEPRFVGADRLRWIAVTGEPGQPPVLRLYWSGALFGREGRRPAEALADALSGTLREVRSFLPRETQWPARLSFGDDNRTRAAADTAIPWPYRGPLRPDGVAFLGGGSVGRFALRDDGADLAPGWNPKADDSIEAARRWAGLYATQAGAYVKRLGQLAFFDAQAKRELIFDLPRGPDRGLAFAIGDFREMPDDKLAVVAIAPGKPYETGGGGHTKTGLRDDAGNGDVTIEAYGPAAQVYFGNRDLPEAGANLVTTLLNGDTKEHYLGQTLKMASLSSLGWSKYDVFLYGGMGEGGVTLNGNVIQPTKSCDFGIAANRTTFVRGVNYVKFEGVSGDSFTLTHGHWTFSAIQVVDASGRPGPRRSLGIRWSKAGRLLGPDDKVGAEVVAGNWYNLNSFFLLTGGCQTAAGKRVCGFVDIFDRKTGQIVGSHALPAGEAPTQRTIYDCQAKILDDGILATDSNGVYLFRAGK